MRIVVAALAAAAIAALAFSADAAPSNKKKARPMASKESSQPQGRMRDGAPQFGYDATPEHYRTGSNEWWRAMERQGRGGFGDTP
jgi:hypothetical protein